MDVSSLPHLNATLNGIATILLLVGVQFIRRGQETAHKRTMIACFAVSVVFLISYLTYHYHAGSKHFPHYPPVIVRRLYLTMLASHIILAATVPFLAVGTIVLGLLDRRQAHRRLARITFPIWLYVSITGVLVYLALYQIYPPKPADLDLQSGNAVIEESSQFALSNIQRVDVGIQ